MKVMLIHGLSRTPASFWYLSWRLESVGWQTEHFAYAAFLESFDDIVERLRGRLKSFSEKEPYAIVAHSLGGLLTRSALGHSLLPLPRHVVMLGTPNQPPRLAPLAWRLLPFQWLTGQCGFNLTQPSFFDQLPKLRSPYTIVAGIGGPRGWFSPFGNEANDGIVAVDETRLSDRDRLIQLPVEHTFMMLDQQVQVVVTQILQQSLLT